MQSLGIQYKYILFSSSLPEFYTGHKALGKSNKTFIKLSDLAKTKCSLALTKPSCLCIDTRSATN